MNQRTIPFVKDYPYHVYNRGHNKQAIFLNYKDYLRYFKRLKEYLLIHNITLLAYCFMPNHVHLLLQQNTDDPIDRFIHRLHTAYTMYFNKKYERVGAVFQGRFKAKLIETDAYLLQVSRYIHLNPLDILRAQGRALSLEDYQWSSYGEYVKLSDGSLSDPTRILAYFDKQNLISLEPAKDKADAVNKYRRFVEDTIPSVSDSLMSDIDNANF